MAYCRCLGCMEVFDYDISTVCPHCGYDQNTGREKPFHLDPGTELEGKYTIGKAIGSGGFAITYVAWDSVLAKKIAVKEYLPTDFATRSSTSKDVVPYDDSEKSYQYEMGLNSFVKEAHTLAQLNKNDGIVHIYDTFIENNTAYIVMEFVSGTKLSDILKTSGVMPYRDIINLLVPSMKALDTIHNQGVVHRDIAPDNIIKTETGAKLIDFGAARHSTSLEGEHSISVLLKPGYAPQEQYSTHGNQDAWTDVYAMAAVIYHMITGKIPPESVKRLQKDEIIPPSAMGVEIDSNVEAVLMKALSVQIEDRYQTTGEFAEALEDALPALEEPAPPPVISKKMILIIIVCIIVALAAIIGVATTVSSQGTNNDALVGYDVDDSSPMPDFTGHSYYEAYETLKDTGWQITITRQASDDESLHSDDIISQSVETGTELDSVADEDKVIEFVIVEQSDDDINDDIEECDWVLMPDVTGKQQDEATQALAGYGVENVEIKTKESNKYSEGTVMKQSVEQDSIFAKADTVTLTVAVTPTTTTTTTTTTKRATTTKKATTTTQKTTTKKSTTKSSGEYNVDYKTTTSKKKTTTTAASDGFDVDF